jgi:hypothetical protein
MRALTRSTTEKPKHSQVGLGRMVSTTLSVLAAQNTIPEIMSLGTTIVGESGRHYVLEQVLQERGQHGVCLAT